MKNNKGFTLIELMIVTVIMGILLSIGVPAYMSYVKAGERGDAVAALLKLSNQMEKFYLINNTYDGATVSSLMGSSKSANELYTLAFEGDPDAYGYTVKATPVLTDEDCGELTLNSIGKKTAANGSVDKCW